MKNCNYSNVILLTKSNSLQIQNEMLFQCALLIFHISTVLSPLKLWTTPFFWLTLTCWVITLISFLSVVQFRQFSCFKDFKPPNFYIARRSWFSQRCSSINPQQQWLQGKNNNLFWGTVFNKVTMKHLSFNQNRKVWSGSKLKSNVWLTSLWNTLQEPI